MCNTSPSFVAEPDGMLSVHIRNPVTALRQPAAASADIVARTAAAPGHVHLHRRVHRIARLQADPTGVVHDPLADQGEVSSTLGGAPRPVRQLDHARRLGAAGVDAEQAATSELDEAVEFEHLDADPGLLADLSGQGGEARGREMAGRRVGQVAGEHRRPCSRATASDAGLDRPLPVGGRQQGQRLQWRGVAVRFQGVEAVAGQQHTFDDSLSSPSRVAAGLVEARRQGGVLGHGAGERGCGVAQLRIGRLTPTGADGDDVCAVTPGYDQRLARLALEPEAGERRAVDPELTRHRALLPDRHTYRPDR